MPVINVNPTDVPQLRDLHERIRTFLTTRTEGGRLNQLGQNGANSEYGSAPLALPESQVTYIEGTFVTDPEAHLLPLAFLSVTSPNGQRYDLHVAALTREENFSLVAHDPATITNYDLGLVLMGRFEMPAIDAINQSSLARLARWYGREQDQPVPGFVVGHNARHQLVKFAGPLEFNDFTHNGNLGHIGITLPQRRTYCEFSTYGYVSAVDSCDWPHIEHLYVFGPTHHANTRIDRLTYEWTDHTPEAVEFEAALTGTEVPDTTVRDLEATVERLTRANSDLRSTIDEAKEVCVRYCRENSGCDAGKRQFLLDTGLWDDEDDVDEALDLRIDAVLEVEIQSFTVSVSVNARRSDLDDNDVDVDESEVDEAVREYIRHNNLDWTVTGWDEA